MVVGKVLQVLIVGGYHAVCLLLAKLLQHSLGNGTANLRFRSSAKLVYQQQRPAIALAHHVLHVEEMTRIRTQVVLYTLLVAYVYHHVVEYTRARTLAHWYRQSALQHILQQSHRLQAHRLSSGIRARDKQNALLGSQGYVQRHHLLVVFRQ